MSADCVLFAVRAPRAQARARADAVAAYYAPCGVRAATLVWCERLGLLAGRLDLAAFDAPPAAGVPPAAVDQAPPAALVWAFGERLPAALTAPSALLDATDMALRVLDGGHGAFALAGAVDRARIVAGAGAPTTWYAAPGAWATHACAAALLTDAPARIDPQALPELLALGACLGERTHLCDVRALAPATVVDITPGQALERSFWPRAERWAAIDPGEADARARAALADTLERRLRDEPAPWLALTAGRDSPLVAAVAAQLGLALPTFTWGEADWPDVTGARAVASAFGVPHRHQPLAHTGDEAQARATAIREALWSDGAAALGGYGLPTLPDGMTALVTGAGAEVARAYYYHWAARARPRPRPHDLLDVLGPLARVPQGHRSALDARLVGWLADTAAIGHAGWTALDVFYTEERMGRWGRARLARHRAALVTPFPSPAVARALVSLPFEDRMTLAWHRRLVAQVAPSVALPAQRDQRRGVPAPLRRAAARVRRRAAAGGGQARWPGAAAWTRLPGLRDWILRDPLADPLIERGLGADWAQTLRDGLRSEQATASDQALLAAAAAVVDARLRSVQ